MLQLSDGSTVTLDTDAILRTSIFRVRPLSQPAARSRPVRRRSRPRAAVHRRRWRQRGGGARHPLRHRAVVRSKSGGHPDPRRGRGGAGRRRRPDPRARPRRNANAWSRASSSPMGATLLHLHAPNRPRRPTRCGRPDCSPSSEPRCRRPWPKPIGILAGGSFLPSFSALDALQVSGVFRAGAPHDLAEGLAATSCASAEGVARRRFHPQPPVSAFGG